MVSFTQHTETGFSASSQVPSMPRTRSFATRKARELFEIGVFGQRRDGRGDEWVQGQRGDRFAHVGLGIALIDLPRSRLIGRDVELEPNPLRIQLFPARDLGWYKGDNRFGGRLIKLAGDEILHS